MVHSYSCRITIIISMLVYGWLALLKRKRSPAISSYMMKVEGTYKNILGSELMRVDIRLLFLVKFT